MQALGFNIIMTSLICVKESTLGTQSGESINWNTGPVITVSVCNLFSLGNGNRSLPMIVFLMHLKQKKEMFMGFCFPLTLQIYEESKMNLEQERPFVCSAPGCSQVSVRTLCAPAYRKCFTLSLERNFPLDHHIHWDFFPHQNAFSLSQTTGIKIFIFITVRSHFRV